MIFQKFNNNNNISPNNSSDVNRVDNPKTSNSTDSEKTRKKRHELSVSANKTINMHNYSIVLTFE